MASGNLGVCERCRQRMPATHVVRDGKVYLRKDCPACGPTEALVSSNAAAWRRKRELCEFDADAPGACSLDCASCGHEHHQRTVFLDVTNRCNMNCPICLVNIPGMGFEFNPPLAYFRKVLAALAELDPKPTVELFGGEPTLREDLFDIVALCREFGLKPRIFTNGLRLADEGYCRRLCDAKVPLVISFDGRDPEIYRKLRRNGDSYARKLRALENLKKHARRKNTILCCVARHINDRHMADLVQFCHENQDVVSSLHLIPLTEAWEEGAFAADVTTTLDDVEQIMSDAFPGEGVEFVPAGLGQCLEPVLPFFGRQGWTYGRAHPNCDSMAILVSDGARYRPLSHYLKRPLDDLARDVRELCKRLAGKLAGLDPERPFQRWRGRLLILRSLLRPMLRSLNLRRIFKGHPAIRLLRILAGLALGTKPGDLLRRHTNVQGTLRLAVLPFEEYHSVESARVERCPSAFVFEDPATGRVRTVPVCAWPLYRAEVLRGLAEKYASRPRLAPALESEVVQCGHQPW